MPLFFSATGGEAPVGRTVACPDSSAVGSVAPLSLDPDMSFASFWAIVTSVSGSDEVSLQAQVMAGGDVGVHVTGDKPTALVVSGFAVPRNCANLGDTRHGIGRVRDYFQRYKASQRQEPCIVTLARAQILGFLIKLDWSLTDPATLLAPFSLQYLALPSVEEPAREGDGGGEGEEDGEVEPPEGGGLAAAPAAGPNAPFSRGYADSIVGGYYLAGSPANYSALSVAGDRPYLAGPPGF